MLKRQIKNVIAEDKVIQLLGVTKDQLNDLRRSRGLPFIQVTKTSRLYFENSLIEWLAENERNLGSVAETEIDKQTSQ